MDLCMPWRVCKLYLSAPPHSICLSFVFCSPCACVVLIDSSTREATLLLMQKSRSVAFGPVVEVLVFPTTGVGNIYEHIDYLYQRVEDMHGHMTWMSPMQMRQGIGRISKKHQVKIFSSTHPAELFATYSVALQGSWPRSGFHPLSP